MSAVAGALAALIFLSVFLLVLLLIACRRIESMRTQAVSALTRGYELHREALGFLSDLDRADAQAAALRQAAEKYDNPATRGYLTGLAMEYQPGGPSMPAIFLRSEADRIEWLAREDHE